MTAVPTTAHPPTAHPPTAVIRDAAAADIGALAAIEADAFETWMWRLSRRAFAGHIAGGRNVLRLVTVGDDVAGYYLVLLRRGSGLARLYSLAVAPAFRGRGLARRLVEDAEAAARRRGRTRMSLEVAPGNVAARGLYRGLGFAETRRLPSYYAEGLDALRMEKRLAG